MVRPLMTLIAASPVPIGIIHLSGSVSVRVLERLLPLNWTRALRRPSGLCSFASNLNSAALRQELGAGPAALAAKLSGSVRQFLALIFDFGRGHFGDHDRPGNFISGALLSPWTF